MRALLGGSFDPIHLGHLALAEAVVDRFGAETVYLVPAYRNPLKDPTAAPAADRLRMVEIALEGLGRDDVRCLSWELEKEGPSYTIDTLRRFRREFPGPVALVLGEEVFRRFPEWKSPEAILAEAELWVLGRSDDRRPPEEKTRAVLGPLGSAGKVRWIEAPTFDVSSTELRRRLESDKIRRAAPPGLPSGVWEWIKKRSLYAVTEG